MRRFVPIVCLVCLGYATAAPFQARGQDYDCSGADRPSACRRTGGGSSGGSDAAEARAEAAEQRAAERAWEKRREERNALYDRYRDLEDAAVSRGDYQEALRLALLRQRLRDGPQVRAMISWHRGDIARAAGDTHGALSYYQQSVKTWPDKADEINRFRDSILAQEQAARDARDRVPAGARAAGEVASFRGDLDKRIAGIQGNQGAAIAAADARVRAYMASNPIGPLAGKGSTLFGTTATPANPDLGGPGPAVGPQTAAGAASAQAGGAAKAGQQAVGSANQPAPSLEEAKRLAGCQFENVAGCASAPPIDFRRADGRDVQAAVFPGLSKLDWVKLQGTPEGGKLIKDADALLDQQAALKSKIDQIRLSPDRAQRQPELIDASNQLNLVNKGIDGLQGRAKTIVDQVVLDPTPLGDQARSQPQSPTAGAEAAKK